MKTDSEDLEMRDLLRKAVPAPGTRAYEDWEDVLSRAGVRRQTRTRPLWCRRWALAVAAGTLMLAAGAGIAAVTVEPWWEDAPPAVNPKVVDWQLAPGDGTGFPATADRSRARTVAKEDGAALVAAPIGRGGYCVIPSLPGSPNLGFSCVYQLDDEFRSYARPPSAGTPRWIVYGRITDPEAATLDLSEAAGVPFEVALQRGGFFLANVPEGRWNELSGQAGRGRILDASGQTLRSGCVNWGPSPHRSGAGLGRYAFWSESDGPCRPRPLPVRPRIDLDRAKRLVSLTLTSEYSIWEKGTVVAVWRAPTQGGGECVYVAPASPRPTGVSQRLPSGPGSCRTAAPQRPPSEKPFGSMMFSVDSAGLLMGEVSPASGIVRVELRAGNHATELPFSNGYFLGQLPEGGSPGTFPPGGPFTIVGYDAAGEKIGSIDLEEFHRQATPP
jgi:hypothetical protein